MSFFSEVTAPVDGSFDAQESFEEFQTIPEGTILTAMITAAEWKTATKFGTDEEETFINLQWQVVDGEFQNRVLFQKVRAIDVDAAKRMKALQMLAAIDANAGGKIMAQGVQPDDMMLAVSLCNVPMLITASVWEGSKIDEKTGKKAEGNWVSAVSKLTTSAQPMQQQPMQQQPVGEFGDISF